MRERDDDRSDDGDTSLADGLGVTTGPGGHESSGEPYGGEDLDDSYDVDLPGGDDTSDVGDVDDVDHTSDVGDAYDVDVGDVGDDPSVPDDTGYGEGDGSVVDGELDDGAPTDAGDDLDPGGPDDDVDPGQGGAPFDDDLTTTDSSPLEGIGYLLEELRDAVFGGDDDAEAAADPFDPADLATETDLDLTGDGVVDRADLHEAGSVLDLHVDEGHHGPDDGGMIDA